MNVDLPPPRYFLSAEARAHFVAIGLIREAPAGSTARIVRAKKQAERHEKTSRCMMAAQEYLAMIPEDRIGQISALARKYGISQPCVSSAVKRLIKYTTVGGPAA